MSVAAVSGRVRLSEQDCDLEAFRALVERPTDLAHHPHAAAVTDGVLVYEGERRWRLPEFQAYFEARHVQLPLARGDAAFFNPALFHAAGTNRTADVRRTANVLQVCSAFGRAMETVGREAVANAEFPVLLRRAAQDGLVGLTRNAAHAHRWDRIRINGLNIGWTATEGEDATQRAFHGAGDDWREQAAARLPMGRLGQPDEIADFVVFLLSDRSGVVTGSVIDWDQNVLGGLD